MNAAEKHPTAADLANLAGEKLGRKKTQRIIDHCKDCPPCAERLLDEVSRRPSPAGEGLRLSKWNWISIGILVVALLATFGLLLWLLRGAAPAAGEMTEPLSHAARPGTGSPWSPATGDERECMPPMHYPWRVPGGPAIHPGPSDGAPAAGSRTACIPRRSAAACGSCNT
jgi:hypothetical protein